MHTLGVGQSQGPAGQGKRDLPANPALLTLAMSVEALERDADGPGKMPAM